MVINSNELSQEIKKDEEKLRSLKFDLSWAEGMNTNSALLRKLKNEVRSMISSTMQLINRKRAIEVGLLSQEIKKEVQTLRHMKFIYAQAQAYKVNPIKLKKMQAQILEQIDHIEAQWGQKRYLEQQIEESIGIEDSTSPSQRMLSSLHYGDVLSMLGVIVFGEYGFDPVVGSSFQEAVELRCQPGQCLTGFFAKGLKEQEELKALGALIFKAKDLFSSMGLEEIGSSKDLQNQMLIIESVHSGTPFEDDIDFCGVFDDMERDPELELYGRGLRALLSMKGLFVPWKGDQLGELHDGISPAWTDVGMTGYTLEDI